MTRSGYPLLELARVLVSTTTVDDICALAPGSIARLLGADIECSIDLTPDIVPDIERPDTRHVMLTSDEVPVGRLTLHGPEDVDPALLDAIASLLGPAIASRQTTDRDHAALLEEATNLKLDAISMLSHEMRTPLASIKGYATALLLEDTEWDDDTKREFLQIIDQESDRLSRLIQAILESASIDANAMSIEPEPILVPHIARRVVERIAIQSDIHRFDVDFPDDFPIVEADAGRIEQVLTNLVDNAVKYSPEGGLTVIHGNVLPDEVVISVSDQGTGISDDDLKKLFDRFFRASSGRRRVSGTGLGLPITHSIVRAHGGRIWAESEVGVGTTLSFTIPLSRTVR